MPSRPARPPGPVAREIDRDERVVLLALRRTLSRLLRPAHRPGAARDLPALLDALTLAIAEAGGHARRLNDARITRRGERAQQPTDHPPPAELASHACHGAYLGAFATLAEVGHMALATCPEVPACNEAPLDHAISLHLRGALWTLDHAGRVHVFRCR